MIKVSIIVPVYNVGNYLRHCIESVLMQSYRNIELILVDDGSTDDPIKIIDEFEDERLRYVCQDNAGVTATRKRGWQESNGDYCLFLDADDMLASDAVEFFVEQINQGGYDFIQGWFDQVDQNGTHLQVPNNHLTGVWSVEQYINNSILAINDFQSIWIGLYKTEAISDRVFDIDRSIYRGEDSLTLLGILNNCETVLVTDKVFYHYFYRSDSVTKGRPLTGEYLYNYNKIRYNTVKPALRLLIEFHIMQRLVPLYLKFSGDTELKNRDVEFIKMLINHCVDRPKSLRLRIQQICVGRPFLEWAYRLAIKLLMKNNL